MNRPFRSALALASAPLGRARERWPALRRLDRVLRFGLVGISGIVVNSAILWALVRGAGLAIPLASVLATEAAILSNFVLNDRWTFRANRAAKPGGAWRRLLRFNGVALGGMLITAALLTGLTHYAGLPLLLANLLAVAGALAWNYLMSTRWAWRAPADVPAGARPGRVGE
jgi:dolichol-phosphate mannosyltransferase